MLSNRALNEFRAGYASYGIEQVSLTEWSRTLAGAQRHHDRRTEHHVQRLSDRTEQQPSPLSRSERLHVPRQLHDVLRRRRPARREDRRRVPAPAGQHAELQPMRRRHHRQPGPGSRPTSSRSCPTRSTPTPGTWRRSRTSRRNYQVGVSDESTFLTPLYMWKYGALVPGRLENRVAPHGQSRVALRPDLERVRAERRVPAVRDARSAAGRQQLPAAVRVRLSALRSDGHPGRLRAVLQRHPEHERPVAAESADDRRHSSQQRRTPRLCRQPVQRAAADATSRRSNDSAT